MIEEKLNPTAYWGIPSWGFAYGDHVLMDPTTTHTPKLSVIDSGTTLIIFPQDLFEATMKTISTKMKDDLDVDMVCQKENKTNHIELCYFNQTTCKEIAKKLEPWSWVFGDYVF